MSTVHKILLFGAGLFFVLAYIGLGTNLFAPGSEAAKAAQSDFANATTEIKDQKFLIYDNTEISGSQVVSALRRFQKEGEQKSLALYVETGKNTRGNGTWYYNEFTGNNIISSSYDSLDQTKDVTDDDYINPSGMFDATVERDDNGAIRAIKFIQRR